MWKLFESSNKELSLTCVSLLCASRDWNHACLCYHACMKIWIWKKNLFWKKKNPFFLPRVSIQSRTSFLCCCCPVFLIFWILVFVLEFCVDIVSLVVDFAGFVDVWGNVAIVGEIDEFLGYLKLVKKII